MLIALLYHRIGMKGSLSIQQFEEHLLYLKKHFSLVFPGETSTYKSICITFDDATSDFYFNVFPLLKKHQVKVILGVTAHYPLDKTDLSEKERLSFTEQDLFTPFSKSKGYYCTFQELKEMEDSSLVKIASHSYFHSNLLQSNIDLPKEIIFSKILLEEKLSCSIDTFIYPYGKFNNAIRKIVSEYYSWQMRIGSGINFGNKSFIYRIVCDHVRNIQSLFTHLNLLKYTLKTFLNVIRMR